MDWIITNCQAAINGNGNILLAFFIAGILTGVSHCAPMCGPFVMMQTQVPSATKRPRARQTLGLSRLSGAALLPYHAGRGVTYMLLGGLGSFMSQALFNTEIQTFAAILILGLAAAFLTAFASNLVTFSQSGDIANLPNIREQFISAMTSLSRPFLGRNNLSARFGLGLVLGLMPCGMLYSFLFIAAVIAEPLTASFAMAAFALGTVPALFLVGLGGQAIQRLWPVKFKIFKQGLLGINGAALLIIGGGMLL